MYPKLISLIWEIFTKNCLNISYFTQIILINLKINLTLGITNKVIILYVQLNTRNSQGLPPNYFRINLILNVLKGISCKILIQHTLYFPSIPPNYLMINQVLITVDWVSY